MRSLSLCLFLVVVVGCSRSEYKAGETISRPGQADVVMVEGNDPEMQAAQDEARKTLPDFIKKLHANKDPEIYFAVKAGLPTPSGDEEHIWVEDLKYEKGKFAGKLGNEPLNLPGKKTGSEVSFDESAVSDWMIASESGMEGGYTVAILQKRGEQ